MGLPVLVLPEFSCNDVQLGREITLLSAQINVANYRLLKLIAEFDNRGGWKCGGTVRSCAHWLAARCGMTIGAAREKVRVARRLELLPEVESAFSTGELSYSKVRAITRVATNDNEGFMVMMAENTSASHLEKLVSRYQPVDEVEFPGPGLGENDPGLGSGGLGIEGADNLIAGSDAGSNTVSDALDEDERREQSRELFWFQDKDGMWIIHAKLPPEQGQLVMKALEAFVRPLQEERQEDWKAKQNALLREAACEISRRHREVENTRAAYGGSNGTESDGVVAGGTRSCGADRGLTEMGCSAAEDASNFGALGQVVQTSGSEYEKISAESCRFEPGQEQITAELLQLERAREKISVETFSQFMNHVRADAFAAMAEHFLATSGEYRQFRGLRGAERCQVVLHVDVNTLREQRSGVCCTHGKAHFEDKPWILPETARRLSCDASLVTVLEDDAGNVLNVGRRSRVVPAHIRRALSERDDVCRYPGCHEARYVDAHHIKHWAEGGETSLANLVTLCRFHHRQLHRGRFEIRRTEAGLEWIKNDSAEFFEGRER